MSGENVVSPADAAAAAKAFRQQNATAWAIGIVAFARWHVGKSTPTTDAEKSWVAGYVSALKDKEAGRL